MRINNETKVGVLAVISIALLILGFNFLKGKNLFSRALKIYAVYDHVDGLVEGNAVLLNGYKIGQVVNLSLSEKEKGKIITTMNITKNVSIPENSVAKIFSTDLLGSKAISLELGDSKNMISSGGTLKSEVAEDLSKAVSREMLPVKEKAEELFMEIDSVLQDVRTIFSEENKRNLASSLSNLNETLKTFNEAAKKVGDAVEQAKIDTLVMKIQNILQTISKSAPQLEKVFSNSAQLTDSLVNTLNSLNRNLRSAESVLNKTRSGEGTLGKLLMDEALYNNLTHATASLDSLLTDLKRNPRHYFSPLGKKPKNNK